MPAERVQKYAAALPPHITRRAAYDIRVDGQHMTDSGAPLPVLDFLAMCA